MARAARTAIIYVRQSLDRTGEALGVTRQRKACEELCAQRGWQVLKVITDNDTSATSGKPRAGFAELLGLVDDRAADVIVCWHVDRLARQLADLENVISRCEGAGVALATVSGDLDLGTDAGRLVGRILGAVARGEVERKSARQVAANRQRAELGRARTGRRAFGYAADGVTVVPAEAAWVRASYEGLLAGRSVNGLVADLNRAGMFTARGGRPWERVAFLGMLRNPRYIGLSTYRGKVVGPAVWEAIVDEPTWRAAVSMLDARRKPGHPNARRHLGTSLYLCGVCDDGTECVSAYANGGAENEPTRRVYICRTGRHLCRTAALIDDYVEAMVIARVTRDDARQLLVDAAGPDLPALLARELVLTAKLEEIAREYNDPTSPLTMSQVRIMTADVQGQLDDIEQAKAHPTRAPILRKLIEADDPVAEWARTPLDRRRAIVDALFTVTVLKGLRGNAARVVDTRTVRVDER